MFHYRLMPGANFNIDKNILDSIFVILSNNIPQEQNGTINIVFLDDLSIKKLNNDYRKINRTTDVLSFHYFEDFSNITSEDIAGEVILSENALVTQGIDFGLGTEKEFYKLLIHSLLHILGYDHEQDADFTIMENFEKIVWKKVFEI